MRGAIGGLRRIYSGWRLRCNPMSGANAWLCRPGAHEEIPFQQAAEIGTRKVIRDHSTLGPVVTTDGSFTDIPRKDFQEPEARIVAELKQIGKPCNSVTQQPEAGSALELRRPVKRKVPRPGYPVQLPAPG